MSLHVCFHVVGVHELHKTYCQFHVMIFIQMVAVPGGLCECLLEFLLHTLEMVGVEKVELK